MADSKYGRLFTEADVRELLRHSLPHSADPDRAFVNAEYNGWRPTFPPDEPLFLLRGQDRFALDGVSGYFDALQAAEDVHADWLVSEEHRDEVAQAGVLIERWQAQHPDRVKAPD